MGWKLAIGSYVVLGFLVPAMIFAVSFAYPNYIVFDTNEISFDGQIDIGNVGFELISPDSIQFEYKISSSSISKSTSALSIKSNARIAYLKIDLNVGEDIEYVYYHGPQTILVSFNETDIENINSIFVGNTHVSVFQRYMVSLILHSTASLAIYWMVGYILVGWIVAMFLNEEF